jgi:hypothetical protein
MGRAAVRAAIAAYLDPSNSNITGLGAVFAHPARFTPEGDFYANEDPGTSDGAVIFLHLEHVSAKRIELKGASAGGKQRKYTLALDCFIRSSASTTQECGAFADTFLDSLTARIEADKNAGAPSVIFQWGEAERIGEPDLDTIATYPHPIGNAQNVSQVRARITTTILEQT